MTTKISLFSTLVLIFFAGCATPQHEDAWRYKAAASTKAYGEYFLKDERVMIESNFSHAERAAKQSADLRPLARLYLSRCALNRAVLVDDACEAFTATMPVHDDAELSAYYDMLQSRLSPSQIDDLPPQYRRYAKALLSKDAAQIRKLLGSVTPLRSRLVAASVARSYLDDATIEAMIEEASYLGYRRAVTAWMQELHRVTSDAQKKALLERKLELLKKSR